MGRTLPTVVQLVDGERENWKDFRRALRKEDQEAFDAVWRLCRYHAAPISMSRQPVPFDRILMAACVGLMRRLMDLEARLAGGNPDAGSEEKRRGMDL